MNSILQALFHNREFRRRVYGLPLPTPDSAKEPVPSAGGAAAEQAEVSTEHQKPESELVSGANEPGSDEGDSVQTLTPTAEELKREFELFPDSIPRQLQVLFARLELSAKAAIPTQNLTKSFGWKSEDAFEQHDLDELVTVLLEALERRALDAATSPASLFQGVSNDVLSFSDPEDAARTFRRVREDPFTHISLWLDDTMGSLEAALQHYVQPETIEGYRPDELDGRETTLTKALLFARLPECLLIQLKRFRCARCSGHPSMVFHSVQRVSQVRSRTAKEGEDGSSGCVPAHT